MSIVLEGRAPAVHIRPNRSILVDADYLRDYESGPLNGYALALDFANRDFWISGRRYAPVDTLPGYAFTRSGEQGALDAAGAVDWYGPNEPAINDAGFHAFGALTNFVAYSQDFAQWPNAAVYAHVNDNVEIAPDGTMTADKIFERAATNYQVRYWALSGLSSGAVHSPSVFLKKAERRYAQVAFAGNASPYPYCTAIADLETGVVTHSSAGNGGTLTGIALVDSGDGWWRVCLRGAWADTAGFLYVGVVPSSAPALDGFGLVSYAGDGTSGIYAWQGQTLEGNFPDGGPIIRTAGATAAIGASYLDVDDVVGADADQLFMARYTQPASLATGGTFGAVASWRSVDNNSRVQLLVNYAGPVGAIIVSGGSTILNHGSAAVIPPGSDVVIFMRRLAGQWRWGFVIGGAVTYPEPATTLAFPANMAQLDLQHWDGTPPNTKTKGVARKLGSFATDAAIIAAAEALG